MQQSTLLQQVVALVVGAALTAACAAPGERGGDPQEHAANGKAQIPAADTEFVGTIVDEIERPDLDLRSTTGTTFDLQDRPLDEATVVFFGYTHCPDVCPTTMADLAIAYRALPPTARQEVTVVFVTEDPRRDTPSVLHRWLANFDRDFVGLMGGGDRTRAALRQLYLPATRIEPDPHNSDDHPADHHNHSSGGGDYIVGHSGIVYVFGPDDRTLIYTGGESAGDYAVDLEELTQ